MSQQEVNDYGNATGTRTGNQGTNNNQWGNAGGTNIGMGTGTNTGMGANNGTGIYNGAGTGTTTGINSGTAAGVGTGTGTGTTTNNTTNIGIGQNAGNTAGDALSMARTTLVNSMMQKQSDNVITDEKDTNVRSRIDNWKLAVSRALDQARR